jgi:hypothetical protein
LDQFKIMTAINLNRLERHCRAENLFHLRSHRDMFLPSRSSCPGRNAAWRDSVPWQSMQYSPENVHSALPGRWPGEIAGLLAAVGATAIG